MRVLDLLKYPVKRALAEWNLARTRHHYGRPHYIFILSHMRAFTSLLAHILGSHPEISGHIEQHLSYPTRRALWQLHWRSVRYDVGLRKPKRFVLDKVLGNYFLFGDDVLSMQNVRAVFMLREPEPTLKSILKFFEDWPPQYIHSERKALDYYVNMLAYLRTLAEKMTNADNPVAYLDAERLVDDTATCLALLQRYLELSAPLSEDYCVFPDTGQVGRSDTSEYIRAGRIRRDRPQHEVALSTSTVAQATAAYEACRRVLLERSVHP